MGMFARTTKDRLIVLLPIVCPMGGWMAYCAAFRPEYAIFLISLASVAIAGALLSLLPPVRRARIRLMRLRYPSEV